MGKPNFSQLHAVFPENLVKSYISVPDGSCPSTENPESALAFVIKNSTILFNCKILYHK